MTDKGGIRAGDAQGTSEQERATRAQARLSGPVPLVEETDTYEGYACGCRWLADDTYGGIWQPCERAKTHGWEHCPLDQDEPMTLAFFDVETDGLDTATSRIVELAILRDDGQELVTRVNPGRPIPPEATQVHGITDADVAALAPFKMIAPKVQAMIDGAVLCSYAGHAFDTLILHNELRRAGQAGIDLDRVQEIDLYRVWRVVEPRTLVGALARYCGMRGDGIHHASWDAGALTVLLPAMRRQHGLNLATMMALTRPEDEVDRSGKFRRTTDGVIVFAFGKYEGEPALAHRDYLEWMLDKDFPADTVEAISRLLRMEVWQEGLHQGEAGAD